MLYDPSKLEKLPGTRLKEISEANLAVIRALQAAGHTVPQIARNAGMKAAALRMLLLRRNEKPAARMSPGLSCLTRFIVTKNGSFEEPVRAIFATVQTAYDCLIAEDVAATVLNQAEYERLVSGGYAAILAMLGISRVHALGVYQKIDGIYLAYRWSIYRDDILVSRIIIRERAGSGGAREFLTLHYDNMEEAKASDGVVIPMGSNIYMAGDLEKGQGLDILTLREPLNANANLISGFQITMDNDRRPFFSRTLLVRSREAALALENKELLCVRSREDVATDPLGDKIIKFFDEDPVQRIVRIDMRNHGRQTD
jgi:hypothetical protein